MVLGFDGKASSILVSASSGTVSLTTVDANDVIILFVAMSATLTTVTSVSSAHVVWQTSARATENGGIASIRIIEWWGVASAALTAEVITVNLGGSPGTAFLYTFGISGANTTSPFDSNVSLPAIAAGASAAPTVSASTTAANTFAFAGMICLSDPTTTATLVFGQTANDLGSIASGAIATTDIGWFILTAAAASQTSDFTLSTSNTWAIIADAVVPAGGAVVTEPYLPVKVSRAHMRRRPR